MLEFLAGHALANLPHLLNRAGAQVKLRLVCALFLCFFGFLWVCPFLVDLAQRWVSFWFPFKTKKGYPQKQTRPYLDRSPRFFTRLGGFWGYRTCEVSGPTDVDLAWPTPCTFVWHGVSCCIWVYLPLVCFKEKPKGNQPFCGGGGGIRKKGTHPSISS